MMLAIKVSMKITTLLLLTGLVAASTPAFAQDEVKSDSKDEGAPRIQINIPQATRPSALPAMYVSLAGLQAYDCYSTARRHRVGAIEANPLVGGLVGQPAAFWAVKRLSTLTTISFAQHRHRQHK